MSLDAVLRDAFEATIRSVLPPLLTKLLADLAGRPKLIPLDQLPVNPRLVLAAERLGEIRIYRKGHYRAVDEAEFYSWVKRGTAARTVSDQTRAASDQTRGMDDEIDRLIAAGKRRHRRRGRAP